MSVGRREGGLQILNVHMAVRYHFIDLHDQRRKIQTVARGPLRGLD